MLNFKYSKELFLLLILAALNLVIFSQIFPSFFFADDFYYIYANIASNPLELLSKAGYLSFHDFFRPVFYLIFGINHAIFKLNYHGYYIVNLLFHLLNGFLVYLLAARITKSKATGMLAGILFTVFPGHWEAVGWLNPINHLTMVASFLSSLILFDRYLDDSRQLNLISSAFMYFVALSCHEGSITLIAMIFLLGYFRTKKYSMNDARKLIPYLIVLIFYLCLNAATKYFLLTGVMSKQYVFGMHFVLNLLEYLSTLIIPATIQYKLSALIPGTIMQTIICLKYALYLIIPLGAAALLYKGSKPVKFFTVWPFIALLPFTFFTTPHTSRYLYLASVGLSALLAVFISYLYANAHTRVRKIMVMAGALFIITAYLGGMIAYQKVLYYKKEIRRGILIDLQKQVKSFNAHRSYYFVDLPIREDEIRYMIYLWYGTKNLKISLIEGKEVPLPERTDDVAVYEYRNGHIHKIK